MTRYTAEVKYDKDTDEHYLQFDPEVLSQMGWDFGDTITWKDNNDGSFTLTKKVDNQPSDQTSNVPNNGATEE
jgi:hypothetical protein